MHLSKDLPSKRAILMVLGSLMDRLIIQEREGISDRHLVQHTTESPYLQYFPGLEACQGGFVFNPSFLTYFRKRLDSDAINRVNEWIVQATRRR